VFVLWMWVGMGGRTKVEIVDMVAVLVSMCDCLRWGSVDVALLAVYFLRCLVRVRVKWFEWFVYQRSTTASSRRTCMDAVALLCASLEKKWSWCLCGTLALST
jgi:hypothetical protein